MTKNYFAPHKIVAKSFRAPLKIFKNFSYPTHIRSARVPGIKNSRSLTTKSLLCYLSPCQGDVKCTFIEWDGSDFYSLEPFKWPLRDSQTALG